MHKKEALIWAILFFAVVVAVIIFKNSFSSPKLFVTLRFSNATTSAYLYQNVPLHILISNKGNVAAKGINMGIFENGNLINIYNVTLPPNMSVTIPFNYTFSKPGSYVVLAEVDPGHLYNIANRSFSSIEINLTIKNPEETSSYGMLRQNSGFENYYLESPMGYLLSQYLYQRYGLKSFAFSSIPSLNRFFYSLLNYTTPYISNVSYAEASSKNNTKVAVWVDGYLSPRVIQAAAAGLGLNISNYTEIGLNATVVQLSDNTTLCSWYSSGWIKNIVYEGKDKCTAWFTSNSGNETYAGSITIPNLTNSTQIGIYSFNSDNRPGYGKLFATDEQSYIYEKIMKKTAGSNNSCLGVISYLYNTSYCSKYILPVSGAIGNVSLIQTIAIIGAYNISVLSLINTSKILSQVPENVNIIHSLNVSGASVNFISALSNSCSFNNGILCSNASFGNGTISFRLSNNLSKNITVTAIGCVWKGPLSASYANIIIPQLGSANITSKCYNYGIPISGVPLNLNLDLILNYTAGNSTFTAGGIAHII